MMKNNTFEKNKVNFNWNVQHMPEKKNSGENFIFFFIEQYLKVFVSICAISGNAEFHNFSPNLPKLASFEG